MRRGLAETARRIANRGRQAGNGRFSPNSLSLHPFHLQVQRLGLTPQAGDGPTVVRGRPCTGLWTVRMGRATACWHPFGGEADDPRPFGACPSPSGIEGRESA